MIDGPICRAAALHRAANLREMLKICSRPDVHVHARYREVVPGRQCENFGELVVPDSVLGVVAAGVRLLAVAVTETGVDPQRDVPPGRALAELVDHVGRADVHVDPAFNCQREGLLVKDVRRVHDRRRVAHRLVSGCERALELAGAHGIHEHAVLTHEIKNRDVGTRLLGVADHVKRPQILDAFDDRARVVYVTGRAEPGRQLADRNSGDIVT